MNEQTNTRRVATSPYSLAVVMCFLFLGLEIFSTRLAWPYEAIPEFTGGDLSGTVKVQGTIPHPKRFNLILFPDPYYCGRVSDGTGWRITPMPALGKQQELPGAVVFLEHIERGKARPHSGSVIQTKHCIFLPYTNATQIGQTLQFENWDPIQHKLEVFVTSDDGAQAIHRDDLQPHLDNRKSDYLSADPSGSLRAGPPVRFTVERSGILVFRCQLHDYMEGWILVLTHPYFSITGEQGNFQLTDIPPGSYNLTVWHPLGEQKTTVKIEDNQNHHMEILLTPKSPTTYEDERKESPFGIDLVGDATILPTVEHQTWNQVR